MISLLAIACCGPDTSINGGYSHSFAEIFQVNIFLKPFGVKGARKSDFEM